ncbi:phage tail tape measure protein [Neorhizobium sp. T786]|uniref:phage tail tape measure protein n=1 Tax=Pseudorhizobium xiangyangii TaxID=2883104 RepID=UPI001D000C98|nr:phage tail tape measure protein [Neorhizobium xiangyangii]MCB5203952.1 phage tail tape measure protein [Neorhizobium xiangyangii]
MSSIDVGVRLRLEYQKQNAEQAERDLKEIRKAANDLGRTNASGLDRHLAEVRKEAGKGEQALERLGREARQLNSVTTNALDREVKQLGASSRAAQRDVAALKHASNSLGQSHQGLQQLNRPAKGLNGTMGLLADSAKGAFAGMVAFASVDSIVRGLERASDKFRELNRAATDVAITLEMATPETVANITASNEKLGIRYGKSQEQVNSARHRYAAAGIGLNSQEEILDPTMKAAMTYRTEGETIAQALIAAKENLGISDSDVPLALDMMAKGSKKGRFEVGAMAKNFPSLGAYMSGTGRQGLDGWAEMIAMSQIAMVTSGSEDDAATNLRNWLSKLSSQDTNKRFTDAGLDLEGIKQKSDQDGTSYPKAVLDAVMKHSNGDTFRIGELFGDQQAGMALKPLLDNREQLEQWINEIRNQSAGGLDIDAKNAGQTSYEKKARMDAALEVTASKIGEKYDRVTTPIVDRAVRLVSPEYDRQRTIEEEPELLKENARQRLDLENRILQMEGERKEMSAMGVDLEPVIATLKAQMQSLQVEDNAIIERSRNAAAADAPIAGAEPALGKDMSGAADTAMGGYIDKLNTAGDRAVGIAQDKAAQMQQALNFTATPTISPTFGPPAPAAGPGADIGKQSSLQQSNSVRLTQNISSPNSKMAATRARREQDRAIRQAQARSLYDVGRGLA